jgi:protein involved in polysaccharide export with SLBB domain
MLRGTNVRLLAGCATASLALTGCAGTGSGPQLPPASFVALQEGPGEEYVIGPLDELTVFVWRNPELGAKSNSVKGSNERPSNIGACNTASLPPNINPKTRPTLR